MNNILEEITYSDGRMDSVVKSLYTPAKLKLRARTYEGINRNLNRRRGVVKNATFNIPSSFMAVEVPTGNEGGSYYAVTDSNDLGETKFLKKPNKININPGQKRGIASKAVISKNMDVEENKSMEENSEPVNNIAIPEVPKVEEVVSVSTNNEVNEANTTVAVNEPVPEIPVPQVPAIDPLDAAREKVLSTQTSLSAESEIKDKVEQAEERDVFKDLEKATNEYSIINEEYRKSEQALEEAQKDLENSKNRYGEIETRIEEAENKIRERNEIINSTGKETAEIEEQIKKIEEQIKAKIKLVNLAKEKRLREKRAKEEEASVIINQNKSYQEKIDEKSEKILKLEQQEKELEEKESAALDAKKAAQDRYNSKLSILNAITLPEGIEVKDDMEEVDSITNISQFVNSDYPNDVEEEAYTYKKVA